MNTINIRIANLEDLDQIAAVDCAVIQNDSRKLILKKAIQEQKCLVGELSGKIEGFLTFHTDFFECSFISLVIVSPSARRKGLASRLIKEFIGQSPTEKVFSSTNESNIPMQKVFDSLGFEQSGIVHNLDEGDPEMIYFIRQ
ncbi:GNAT family N-acetyltransferase [Falsibacillus pallidus]|uniref:Ribosomal protein S18 acetylase RimI-like enzyme n=1 Tax=Falsibacillus pallidus TaxID=493781 RepID=A0A370GQF1_9BACI|nr:GNAT family N-acetyltransferase [Falsibacillus pallidus]RDI45629.1 ribosomal protein S18 acetylase RimI-like enzyme [Falsibacillus pallidus]